MFEAVMLNRVRPISSASEGVVSRFKPNRSGGPAPPIYTESSRFSVFSYTVGVLALSIRN